MHPVFALVAAATLGIDAGWTPADGGGWEYVIQVAPETLDALAHGAEIVSDLPPEVRDVRSLRIRVGSEPAPRTYAEQPVETPAARPAKSKQSGASSAAPPAVAQGAAAKRAVPERVAPKKTTTAAKKKQPAADSAARKTPARKEAAPAERQAVHAAKVQASDTRRVRSSDPPTLGPEMPADSWRGAPTGSRRLRDEVRDEYSDRAYSDASRGSSNFATTAQSDDWRRYDDRDARGDLDRLDRRMPSDPFDRDAGYDDRSWSSSASSDIRSLPGRTSDRPLTSRERYDVAARDAAPRDATARETSSRQPATNSATRERGALDQNSRAPLGSGGISPVAREGAPARSTARDAAPVTTGRAGFGPVDEERGDTIERAPTQPLDARMDRDVRGPELPPYNVPSRELPYDPPADRTRRSDYGIEAHGGLATQPARSTRDDLDARGELGRRGEEVPYVATRERRAADESLHTQLSTQLGDAYYPFVVAMVMLFMSGAANLFLGWLTLDLRNRCRRLLIRLATSVPIGGSSLLDDDFEPRQAY